MSRIEQIFIKLTSKERKYLIEDLAGDIISWYDGGLIKSHRKNFFKAITFISSIMHVKKTFAPFAYRAFDNRKELSRNKKILTTLTKPCASFSKNLSGLTSFVKNNLEHGDDLFIVKVTFEKNDVAIDTLTIIKFLRKLVKFIRFSKIPQLKRWFKANCGFTSAFEFKQGVLFDLRNSIIRVSEFRHEREIILKTSDPLDVLGLVTSEELDYNINTRILKRKFRKKFNG